MITENEIIEILEEVTNDLYMSLENGGFQTDKIRKYIANKIISKLPKLELVARGKTELEGKHIDEFKKGALIWYFRTVGGEPLEKIFGDENYDNKNIKIYVEIIDETGKNGIN